LIKAVVKKGTVEIIPFLLDEGADPTAENENFMITTSPMEYVLIIW
jgi:hypothetical protein